MSTFEDQIRTLIECPICFKIPRSLPVSCCGAGHVLCEDCKKTMTFCPICRGSVMYNTNTLAGKISSIIPHPCKFDIFGCSVVQNVMEIVDHEKICAERTVKCPFREV